jgi:hypothetical protein
MSESIPLLYKTHNKQDGRKIICSIIIVFTYLLIVLLLNINLLIINKDYLSDGECKKVWLYILTYVGNMIIYIFLVAVMLYYTMNKKSLDYDYIWAFLILFNICSMLLLTDNANNKCATFNNDEFFLNTYRTDYVTSIFMLFVLAAVRCFIMITP